jgi:transposase
MVFPFGGTPWWKKSFESTEHRCKCMSNSMGYHLWGTKGYNIIQREDTYGKLGTKLHLEPQKRLFVCSCCGSKNVTTKGSTVRTVKTTPVGSKPVFLAIHVPRLHCHDCTAIRLMDTKIVDPYKSYTRQLESFIILLSEKMCIKAISSLLNINWGIVKDIIKSKLTKDYAKPDLRNITKISIDEISIKKGHNYLTVVIDAITGTPLYVGDGKKAEALEGFWKLLGKRRAKRIVAVAIDLGKAYISAVKKNLPHATIVYDHFHVIKIVNTALDDLRKKVCRDASKDDKKFYKGLKYVLLRNEEDLKGSSKERLEKLTIMNTPLSQAYILKEDIRQIWMKKNRSRARTSLNSWLKTCRATGEEILISLADTIECHKDGILDWYKHKINSGRIEGINNKIKLLKRMAFGFRDHGFFKLLILAIKRNRNEMTIGPLPRKT